MDVTQLFFQDNQISVEKEEKKGKKEEEMGDTRDMEREDQRRDYSCKCDEKCFIEWKRGRKRSEIDYVFFFDGMR